MQIITSSTEQTEQLGEQLGRRLKSGTVLALYGGLGAGKTALIRGIARGLGVTQPVTSPTYTIVHEYEGRLPLFHFDMYRLSDSDGLYDIGWEDYLGRGGVCAVEWSEVIEDALDEEENCVKIVIEPIGETQRQITISGGAELVDFSN